MQSSIDLEIREWLAKYLTGETTLHCFRDWFVPRAWSIEQYGNPTAEDLAYEVELRLAEFSNCDWTEDELKSLLRPLVAFYFVDKDNSTHTAASTSFVESAFTITVETSPLSFFDTQLVEVSG